MQLLVGLRDAWKCIAVGLEDGCTPCIGGTPLTECNIEPALWFKVGAGGRARGALAGQGNWTREVLCSRPLGRGCQRYRAGRLGPEACR